MKGKYLIKTVTACLCVCAIAAVMPSEGASGTELTENSCNTLPVEKTPYQLAQAKPDRNGKYRFENAAGIVSNNVQLNGYDGSYHASQMSLYLCEGKGNLYRFEYIADKIIIEKYDSELKYIGKGEIEAELPIFGGFYAGKYYNYIIFGEKNSSESNDKEIMRVVKYSKGMKRLASKSFYGCNTYIPFDAGCPRMDEYNGVLYIHACHEMYKSSDGYHHQANMDFYIKTSDMSTVYSRYDVSNASTGYISHSFNQFIRVNQDGIYTLDHGDSYNRALTAFRRDSTGSKYAGYADIFKIKGNIGENYTGVCVGGMEVSDSSMLISAISVPQDQYMGENKSEELAYH